MRENKPEGQRGCPGIYSEVERLGLRHHMGVVNNAS